jgi:FMN phosphatase YigB (HAD superfamily)
MTTIYQNGGHPQISGRNEVDNKPRNLIPARDLGMTTILINGDCENLAIDYTVPTIFHVENVLRKLLPAR